jgi:hypothetical protein
MTRDRFEQIVVDELSEHYHSHKQRLENKQVGCWSFEWEEEKKELKKLTKALKRVLAYYGENV